MSRTLAWILMGAAVVSVGIGVTVGLGLFRGADMSPPAHHNAPIAAAAAASSAPSAPTSDVGVPVAAAEEEPAVLQPHVEREATTELAGEETTPASDTAAAATPPSGPVALTVWELASAGAEYAGREVVMTGRVLSLCIRGCQLSLDDGTGVMPVELVDDALSNTIPLRSVGRQIEITGVFQLSPRPHVTVERPDGWRFP